ncbi:class I SAM-dependent methyltransferase [Rubripirellula sp.]|nr:class I SAM-dependent methyltransferase [Rubripirellula sp.]MDB4621724.1 class I SAM-dependent methyltransferase [Rubripirellula sp.]
MSKKITREEALRANIEVHSKLANAGEYQKSPHFNSENIEKVRGLLQRVLRDAPPASEAKAIDFGCGTGFIINLIRERFSEVHGVDITQDMMKHVDLTSGNIVLHESPAENTPFENNTFDFATAYSFMDHLVDYQIFLKEAFRVLRPGGTFFSDLNPNREFIMAMDTAECSPIAVTSPLVLREIQGALHNGQYYAQHFNIDAKSLDTAEPIKSADRGFLAGEVYSVARDIGFRHCKVEYEWYLGQGKVMHEESKQKAIEIDNYLNSIAPASSPLFKYLRFVFVK